MTRASSFCLLSSSEKETESDDAFHCEKVGVDALSAGRAAGAQKVRENGGRTEPVTGICHRSDEMDRDLCQEQKKVMVRRSVAIP